MLINHVSSFEVKAQVSVDQNPFLTALNNMTPTQIETWVDSNITNPNDFRDMFKLLLVFIKSRI